MRTFIPNKRMTIMNGFLPSGQDGMWQLKNKK